MVLLLSWAFVCNGNAQAPVSSLNNSEQTVTNVQEGSIILFMLWQFSQVCEPVIHVRPCRSMMIGGEKRENNEEFYSLSGFGY